MDLKEVYKQRLRKGQKNWESSKKQAESFGKPFPEGEYTFQLQAAKPDEVNLTMGGTALVERLEHVCIDGEHENEVCRTSFFLPEGKEGENPWQIADFFLRLNEGVPEDAASMIDAFDELVKDAPKYRAKVNLDNSGRFNYLRIVERIVDADEDTGDSTTNEELAETPEDHDHQELLLLLDQIGQDLSGKSKAEVIEFIKDRVEFEYEDFTNDEIALLDKCGCADKVLNRPAPKKKTAVRKSDKKDSK